MLQMARLFLPCVWGALRGKTRMITAIVFWLGLQLLLAIVVGKFLKVGAEPGLMADRIKPSRPMTVALKKAA
jgi:hypothetical protein